jgi:hypothetical protein
MFGTSRSTHATVGSGAWSDRLAPRVDDHIENWSPHYPNASLPPSRLRRAVTCLVVGGGLTILVYWTLRALRWHVLLTRANVSVPSLWAEHSSHGYLGGGRLIARAR